MERKCANFSTRVCSSKTVHEKYGFHFDAPCDETDVLTSIPSPQLSPDMAALGAASSVTLSLPKYRWPRRWRERLLLRWNSPMKAEWRRRDDQLGQGDSSLQDRRSEKMRRTAVHDVVM